MSEELIQSYIDRPAFKADTDFAISELQRVLNAYENLKNSKTNISSAGGLKDIVAGSKEAEAAIISATKANEGYTASIKTQTEAVKQVVSATREEIKSLNENIETRRRLQASMDSYKASQKEDLALLKAGTITRQEYNQRMTESQIKVEQYKNKIADLSKEIKIQTGATQALTKEQKLAQAVMDSERNSLGRAQALILQYTNEKKKLNLATEEGRRLNENYNKAIAKTNEFILKNADAETIRTKTVGKYAEAITGAAQKAFSFIRTAANIIPGLGLGGAFLLIFEGAKAAAQSMGFFNEKVDETKVHQEKLNDVLSGANSEYVKAKTEVNNLKIAFDQARTGIISKEEALKLYNDTIGKTTGEVNSLDEAEKALAKNAEAYIQFTLLKAAANIALQKASEQAFDAMVAQQNQDEVVYKREYKTGIFGKNAAAQQEADALAFQNQRKAAEKNQKDFLTIQEKFQKDAEEIAKKFKFDYNGIKTPDNKGEKVAAVKQSTKEIFDAEFEETKRQLQRKISLASDQLGNEKLTFDQRIALLQEFSTQSINLINLEAGREKEVLLKKQADLNANLKVAKGTERNNIIAELKDTAQRIIDVDNKAAVERIKVFDNNEKQYNKIQEDAAKKAIQLNKETHDIIMQAFEDQQEEKKALLAKQYLADNTALVDNLQAGLITEKEYAAAKIRINLGYEADKLQLEIDYAKKLIEIRKISGQDVSKEEQKLFDLEMKLNDLKLKKIKDNNKNIAEDYLKTFMTIKDVGEKVFGLIEGLVNAQLIATKNALQAQSDAAEKKAARDIEIVNASTATEEQKAARIAIINARLQAQKDQIAQREREAQEKKARVDKALAIFQITINTAIAVTKALASYDYVGAILAGALGAAQLAVAIATPIPKYKHGKSASDNYEGLAVVDDGGRAEAIQRADGSIEIGSNKPRVAYVGKNDIVHPNADAFMKSAFGVAHNGSIVPHQPVQKQDDSVAREMKKHSALLREIANKPVQRIAATDKGMESVWHWGANEARYAEENCNWKR